MEYKTAYQFLSSQSSLSDRRSFLALLKDGHPPIPGQVTNILLTLKSIFQHLQGLDSIDRHLAQILYRLAYDSRKYFDSAKQQGTTWPPLLNEDLDRIAQAVQNIFANQWLDT
ncbi:MAG: Dethiobiotin synthetase [Limnothrix sp. RL_2_0]|nr:Dethiobiotin synthetase [Limnothrix sp. RL_2_0]